MANCILCGATAVTTRQNNSSRTIYNCERCGIFVVSDLALQMLKKNLGQVSAFVRHRHLAGNNDVVLISFEKARLDKGYLQMTVEQMAEQFPASFSEQMARSLENLALLSAFPGDEVKVETLESAPLFYCRTHSFEELSFVIRSLMKAELVEVNFYSSSFFPCGIVIGPKGWDCLADGSFGSKARPVTLALFHAQSQESEPVKTAVANASRECGTRLQTGEMLDLQGGIGNGLAAQVRECAHLIIDLTTPQPQCFFAMGYAAALNKPVLLTCREQARNQLTVNPAPLGVVFWQEEEQLQMECRNFIKIAR